MDVTIDHIHRLTSTDYLKQTKYSQKDHTEIKTIGLVFAVIVLIFYTLYPSKRALIPQDLPWSGQSKMVFSKVIRGFQGIFDPVSLINDGYRKYTKEGLAFVLPNLHDGNEILVPHKNIAYMLSAPENVLSFKLHQGDYYESKYTTVHTAFAGDGYEKFLTLIRSNLTKDLGFHTQSMIDEIQQCLEDYWGLDENKMKSINLHDTIKKVSCRVTNRTMIGHPHCRNEAYIHAVTQYSEDIAIGAKLIKIFPSYLKPIFGPLLTVPNRWHEHLCYKYLTPITRARVTETRSANDQGNRVAKIDFLQYLIDASIHDLKSENLDPYRLAYRIVMLSFAAVHTTNVAATNALVDMISAPVARGFWSKIVEEATRVSDSCSGMWTKKEVDNLPCLDSAIKESLRLNGFDALGPHRRVVASGGVTLPDGLHVPNGATLGVPLFGIHHDDDIYPNANLYDAFRFCSAPILGTASNPTNLEEQQVTTVEVACGKNSMVSTSDSYLAFSHGRRACPGRYVAAHTIKLLISQIALLYEIEPLPSRPSISWFGRFQIPDTTTKVQVRRRKLNAD